MYFQTLSLSFTIHLLLLGAIYLIEPKTSVEESQPKLVQIEFIDPSTKQLVADAVAPNLDLFSNKKTRFESARSQRVLEERAASQTGKTENRSSIKNISADLLPPLGSEIKGTASVKDPAAPKTSDNDSKQAQVFDQVKQEEVYENLFEKKGISKIQDRIFEDIKYGNFTALNTNRNQFYSFYQRVNEQVRIRWTENIQKHIDELSIRSPDRKFKSGEYISKLEIILNSKGEIINSYVAKSSGQKRWDHAALNAFLSAGPFVNPPAEMTQADGLIRLSYLFSLQL